MRRVTGQRCPRRTGLYVCVVAFLCTGAIGLAQDASVAHPTYESPALEALLADAARGNARIPESLDAYRAAVESEMSIVLIDSGGRERTTQLEQIASEVRWRAPNQYDQRVVGYRSEAIGPTFSLMSMFGGWTTPTLYGNRLQLGVTSKATAKAPEGARTASLTMHPLAETRDSYYTFAGGDTVVTLYSRGRRIPVAVVRITPRADVAGNAVLFAGDLHIDAERKQLVAMRGRMVEIRGGKAMTSAEGRILGTSATTFTELTNVEVNGAYWLPASQRTEFHARVTVLGQFRVVVRIVSRFGDYRLNDSSWSAPAASPARHALTLAPSDSLARFNNWHLPLGAASARAHYADFEDVAPEASRMTNARALRFRPESFSDVFRFNRIEGAFTGIALERSLRGSESGLTMRGSLGIAWAERTPRGALSLERRRGVWNGGARVQRSLAHTNDFQLPLSWGATLSALLGSTDDFDYLDRRSASVFMTRALGLERRSLVRLEVGSVSDRAVERRVSQGLFVEGEGFRPNRGIWPGGYVRTAATLELNPDVSGIFVDRGVGARIHYERADGDLKWQRMEVRSAVRRELGPVNVYARGEAGILFGEPAPQTLFEVGRGEGLGGYDYKEFAGDRAAIVRVAAGYTFPVLRGLTRLPGGLFAPGLAPGLAAGIHGGWTEISGPAARRALLYLGHTIDSTGVVVPVSRPTGGIRASAEALLTFFNGALAVGVARPIDQPGRWQFTWRIGQGF